MKNAGWVLIESLWAFGFLVIVNAHFGEPGLIAALALYIGSTRHYSLTIRDGVELKAFRKLADRVTELERHES